MSVMERLRVLTLNIWNRQGPWEQRLALIRSGLEELSPDIVGLQEVLGMDGQPGQADAIAEGLGYHIHFGATWEIGGGLRFGNAVLSKFPIVDSDVIDLPAPPKQEKRCLIYARLDATCGEVPVFVTHLPWKLHHGHIRCEGVKLIAATIKAKAPLGGFPPILMGDMNAEPDSDEMRYLRGLTGLGGACVYFADCWSAVEPTEHGFTYSRDNSYALRSREPSRRIDYVFVRGPDRQLRGEPLAAEVVFDRATDGVFPSDHYGVLAEIQAAPRTLGPY
jgi:endonuclease/exonuclease/phosphatase family metal-dependent hydrolase